MRLLWGLTAILFVPFFWLALLVSLPTLWFGGVGRAWTVVEVVAWPFFWALSQREGCR